jgi:hypothetical protein
MVRRVRGARQHYQFGVDTSSLVHRRPAACLGPTSCYRFTASKRKISSRRARQYSSYSVLMMRHMTDIPYRPMKARTVLFREYFWPHHFGFNGIAMDANFTVNIPVA